MGSAKGLVSKSATLSVDLTKGSLLPPKPGGMLGRGHFPYQQLLVCTGTERRGPGHHTCSKAGDSTIFGLS